MPISQHTKPGSFCRSSSSGRMPTLLIYSKTHNFQMGLYLLSSMVFPFRQNYLKKQTIRRMPDGWVQSKSRREGMLCLVSSCSDRIGNFYLHHFMSPTGFEVRDRGHRFCLPCHWWEQCWPFKWLVPVPVLPLLTGSPLPPLLPVSTVSLQHMGLSYFPLWFQSPSKHQ